MAATAANKKKGWGRLFKRGTDGKEYPSTSKKPGMYYLEHFIPSANPNKPAIRKKERLTNDAGEPITELDAAIARQKIIRAPYMADDKVKTLEKLVGDLQSARKEKQSADADVAKLKHIRITTAWQAFIDSDDRPDSGPRTISDYAGYFNAFIAWLKTQPGKFIFLREITAETAQSYASYLRRQGISPNTFNKHITFLKLLFRTLEAAAGIVTGNPFGKIKRKELATQSRRELSRSELEIVFKHVSGDLAILLAIGTLTGLRLGDCCTLRWSEIDNDKRVIRRIPNKTGRKKTEPVIIGINNILMALLAQVPPAARTGYVLPRYAELYNFTNESGHNTKRPLITNEIQAHFNACGIQTNRPGTGEGTGKRAVIEVGFHSLRHTWVTLQSERNTPQAIVQASVGHSNPAMTQHYSHVSIEAAHKAAAALELPEIAGAIDVVGTPITNPASSIEPERERLAELVKTLPIESIRRMLNMIEVK